MVRVLLVVMAVLVVVVVQVVLVVLRVIVVVWVVVVVVIGVVVVLVVTFNQPHFQQLPYILSYVITQKKLNLLMTPLTGPCFDWL